MNFEERIINLENKIKYQRVILLILVPVLGFSVLLGTSQDNTPGNATFNEITAKSLTLIGDNGKQIMSMGSGEDGPGFVLFDEDLTPRVALGINTKDKSVGIAFLDKKSNARIAIGTAESGDAGISLLGAGISAPLVGKVWPSQ